MYFKILTVFIGHRTVVLFVHENLAVTFSSDHVETKAITVKLIKISKYTVRNTTCSKAIRFRFTMQYRNFDGIENGGG